MRLALNSATFIKFSTWLSDFVSALIQCSFAIDRWRFPFSWQLNLHSISSIVTFQAENLHSVVPLFQIVMQELYMPWYTQTLQLPCKANGTQDQVDFSLDLLISLKVHKSTRSEDPFFFPVLFSLLYVYEMLARPTLGLFAIENVLKLHAPLHCTAVHNFCQKRVFIICPIQMLSYTKLYDFLRISG